MRAVTDKKLANFQVSDWPKTLPEQNGLQDAIHAPDLAERDRYILALIDSPYQDLQNLARRMATCADSVHLYVDPELGEIHEYLHRCKSRLCPLCARSRAMNVSEQVEDLVKEMTTAKHLVLTVKSTDNPLNAQLRDLRTWFAKLRRTKLWTAKVKNGVYTIETTINEKTGLWHPHIHCVFDGDYIPYKMLQREWHAITGGSEIIWIEKVDNAQGIARELCKYIGKPQKAESWTDEQIRTYAAAIKGARMMQSFGKKPIKAIEDKLPDQPGRGDRWSIGLARILWLADMNIDAAYDALPLIAERFPHLGRYIYQRMPQLEPEGDRAARLLRIMAIIETGRAPPRATAPPSRVPDAIDKDLVPILSILHALSEEEIWQL
jgi:hypothetical protein